MTKVLHKQILFNSRAADSSKINLFTKKREKGRTLPLRDITGRGAEFPADGEFGLGASSYDSVAASEFSSNSWAVYT